VAPRKYGLIHQKNNMCLFDLLINMGDILKAKQGY
jgi:hypothetical protein